MNTRDMQRHIDLLCQYFRIEAEYDDDPDMECWAMRGIKKAYLHLVDSSYWYAFALHEIGHIIGKHQRKRTVDAEAWAWQWALENAIEWRPPMTEAMKESLRSYLAKAMSGGQHAILPPEEDSLFWELLHLPRDYRIEVHA